MKKKKNTKLLNSSPIDQLGSWCLKSRQDPKQFRRSREVTMATCEREPPLQAVASNRHSHTERNSVEYLPLTKLTNLPIMNHSWEGGDRTRVHKNSLKEPSKG